MKVISFYNSFFKEDIKILELESIEDISAYLKFTKIKTDKEIKRYLGNIKPTHVPVRHALSQIVKSMNVIQSLKGDLKIDLANEKEKEFLEFFTQLSLKGYSSLYEQTIKEVYDLYGFIRINASGGIFLGEIKEDLKNTNIQIHTISEISEIFSTENLNLEKDSKFIILENDPEPDKWYSKNIKEKFSSIVNLRDVMDQKKLESYLMEFRWATGSKKIFVYTSGNDIEQMEEYIKLGKKLKFDFEIIFNDKSLENGKRQLMNKYNISYKFKD